MLLHAPNVTSRSRIQSPHMSDVGRWINFPNPYDSDTIIHYHAWMNTRLHYNSSMEEIDFLWKFLYGDSE